MRLFLRARRGFWLALVAVVVSALGAWTDANACTYLFEEQYEGTPGVWDSGGALVASSSAGACPVVFERFAAVPDIVAPTCAANGSSALGPVFAGWYTYFDERYDWRMTPQSGADCAVVQASAGEPEAAVMTPADALEASWLVVIAWASVFAVRFIGTALAGWRDVGGE